MSKNVLARLARIERQSPDGVAFETMTDEQLLKSFRRIIDREGGIEAVAAASDEDEAALYRALYVCKAAAQFMAR